MHRLYLVYRLSGWVEGGRKSIRSINQKYQNEQTKLTFSCLKRVKIFISLNVR